MRSKQFLGLAILGIFTPLFLNGFYNCTLAAQPTLYWAVEIITWIVLPYTLWRYLVQPCYPAAELWIICPQSPSALITKVSIAVFAGIIMALIFNTAIDISTTVFHKNYLKVNFDYPSLIPRDNPGKTLILIYFSFSAGVVEELFFRGFIRRLWEGFSFKRVGFVLSSSILFSIVHWEGGIHSLCATFTVSLFGGCLFIILNDLAVLMLAHAIADIILFS